MSQSHKGSLMDRETILACAKVCDELAAPHDEDARMSPFSNGYYSAATNCAAAIRSLPAAQDEQGGAHSDHPLRHYDRTCPACIAERDEENKTDLAVDAAQESLSRPSAAKQELPEEPQVAADHSGVMYKGRFYSACDSNFAYVDYAADLRTHIENRRGMLTQDEVYAALRMIGHRIEACGASVELTHAVTLCSALSSAIGNQWNKADSYAAERVKKELQPGQDERKA